MKHKAAVKNHGIFLGTNMNSRTHVNQLVQKAEKKARVFTRLLNIEGLSASKRVYLKEYYSSRDSRNIVPYPR